MTDEQNGICCYCCQCLNDFYHIEHIQPKHDYPKLTFDYHNLLISCGGQGNKNHCGDKKGTDKLPITPLMIECDNDLQLNLVGELVTHNSDMQQSIAILNLNDRTLCNIRKRKIDEFLSMSLAQGDEVPLTIDKELLNYMLEDYKGTPTYYWYQYLINKISE